MKKLNEIRVTNRHHGHWPFRRYIYIGRGTPLGNPFAIDGSNTRDQAKAKYKVWLDEKLMAQDPTVINELDRLACMVLDQTGEPVCLECSCFPKPCHGDIVKEILLEVLKDDEPGLVGQDS